MGLSGYKKTCCLNVSVFSKGMSGIKSNGNTEGKSQASRCSPAAVPVPLPPSGGEERGERREPRAEPTGHIRPSARRRGGQGVLLSYNSHGPRLAHSSPVPCSGKGRGRRDGRGGSSAPYPQRFAGVCGAASTAGDLGSSAAVWGKPLAPSPRGAQRGARPAEPPAWVPPVPRPDSPTRRGAAPPPWGQAEQRQQPGPLGRPSPPQPAAPAVPSPRAERRGGGGGSPVTHACVEADQPAIHAF